MANILWQGRWALIGDSIQAWVLDDYDSTPPLPKNLTAVRIPANLNGPTIQNLSCPGATLGGPRGLGRHADDVGRMTGFFGINGVIITLGTNDIGTQDTTLAQFENDYKRYIADLKQAITDAGGAASTPIVCVSPINRFDSYTPANGKTFAAITTAIQNAANAFPNQGVYFLNGQNAAIAQSDTADNLHLNNVGHVKFSNWLYTQVHNLGLW